MPQLEVRNISIGINKDGNILEAVKNISFKIDEGEIVGLAGESGSGKTLTALSIPNLLPHAAKITEGEIIFNNISLTGLSENELCKVRGSEISIIFQDVRQALNPLMRAGKQITETLELGGSKDKEKNKKNALNMLSVLGFDEPEKIFDAFPHQLSGGMCQRVLTAIAAIRRPKLLLGDEPSSSLDEESQNRCTSLIRDLNHNHKTSLLIISHDLSVIQELCERFLIMYAGRIIEEGPSEVLFSPLHPYTKALIDAIPVKEKHGKKLKNIPGKAPSIEDKITGCPFAPRCVKVKEKCRAVFPPPVEIDKRRVYCHFPLTGDTHG